MIGGKNNKANNRGCLIREKQKFRERTKIIGLVQTDERLGEGREEEEEREGRGGGRKKAAREGRCLMKILKVSSLEDHPSI